MKEHTWFGALCDEKITVLFTALLISICTNELKPSSLTTDNYSSLASYKPHAIFFQKGHMKYSSRIKLKKDKGDPIKEYLRDTACKDQIKNFLSGMASVAKSGDDTLEDAENMFSTAFTREMFPAPSK